MKMLFQFLQLSATLKQPAMTKAHAMNMVNASVMTHILEINVLVSVIKSCQF